MNGLVCSHMQEETLGLNMGLCVLFHRDQLIDTNSGTNMGEIRTERMAGKIPLRRANTVYPRHVYRNMRKPAEASHLSSCDKAFLPVFLQPNHGHVEGIQTQHTLRKRHRVPIDLTLASRFVESHSDLQRKTHISTRVSIPSADKTNCQTNTFVILSRNNLEGGLSWMWIAGLFFFLKRGFLLYRAEIKNHRT